MKCPKCAGKFSQVLSRKHTMIDLCQGCMGVWLDEGEINFLVDNRKKLARFCTQGLSNPERTNLNCPKCSDALFRGTVPDLEIEVETCPKCKGIFLDKGELALIVKKGALASPVISQG